MFSFPLWLACRPRVIWSVFQSELLLPGQGWIPDSTAVDSCLLHSSVDPLLDFRSSFDPMDDCSIGVVVSYSVPQISRQPGPPYPIPRYGVEGVNNVYRHRQHLAPPLTAACAYDLTRSIASIVERSRQNPYWFPDKSGPSCARCLASLLATILSTSLLVSSSRHINLNAAGESGALLWFWYHHQLGYLSSFRYPSRFQAPVEQLSEPIPKIVSKG